MNKHYDTNTVKMSALVTATMIVANNRGHGPLHTMNYRDAARVDVFCERCGMEAVADLKPAPNGIDICGELVALDCR